MIGKFHLKIPVSPTKYENTTCLPEDPAESPRVFNKVLRYPRQMFPDCDPAQLLIPALKHRSH